ncbi:glycerol-3-phosphate dehydrogenase [Christensenellaceae bacterium OttesenSCG-928-K19]|nr:glycerol-3-phosphate dehydrogenase [Christensenellaceae bacterium OttesenSCG-928-K19]
MSIITIVGAGVMGSAIGFPARENGNEVRLVGTPLDREIIDHAKKTGEHLTLKRKLPEGYRYYQIEQLADALLDADLLVSGVSSFGVDWFEKEILTVIPESLPVLCVTKGMQDTKEGELIPYPRLYAQHLPGRKLSINAVGGPCTSYELADHDQTEVCFCGDDMETLRKIKAMFEGPYYHISLSTDVVGVECAVAMKNAYALAVTLAVGLSEKLDGKLHYNSQAALFGQSVREMRRLLKLCGGQDDNIIYGAGDLYVTVFGGRTRKIGTLLGQGLSFEQAMEELQGVTLESIVIATRTANAVKTLIAMGKVKKEEFPLLLHVDAVINEGAPVDIPWDVFETEFVL